LKKIEEAEDRCVELLAAKEKAEKETATAKSLVSRLNKEMSKMRSNLETSHASLNQVRSENEELVKSKSGSIDTLKKEIEDMKKMKDQAEKDLSAAKTEIVALSSRLENLKNISRSNKAKVLESQKNLESALKKEREIAKLLEEEKEAHKAALQLAERLQATSRMERGKGASVYQEEKVANEEGVKAPEILQAQSTEEGDVHMDQVETSNSRNNASDEQGAPAKDQDGAIPLPKVPDGGFKFVPSNSSTKLVELAESLVQSSDLPMDEPVTTAAQGSEAKREFDLAINPRSNVPEKLDEEVKKQNDSTHITSSANSMDSLREKLLQKKKRALELKTGAPPAKRHAPPVNDKKESMADGVMEESAMKELNEEAYSELKDASYKTHALGSIALSGSTETILSQDECVSKAAQDSSSNGTIVVNEPSLGAKENFLIEGDKIDTTGSLVSNTASVTRPEPIVPNAHGSSSEATLLPPQPSETKESSTQQNDDSCAKSTVGKNECPEEGKESE
jgi:myosin heavy subunit